MELNLMEEAVKNGSEQETASSVGGDVGADMEEQGLRVGPNSVTDDQAATKGSRFRQLFRWRFVRKEPAVATAKSRLTPGESSGSGKDSAVLEDSLEDGARLIRAPPPPELCFSDEEIDGVVPARRTGVWHRVWGGITAAGRFLLRHWIKLLILAAIITLIVLTAVKGFSVFGDLLRWFQARNNWAGWGMFLGMYTALVALFLPGVVFIMGAGFVFGFWKGLLAVWIGGAIGQAFAFLLARYLLRDWVEATLRGKWRRWEVIDRAISHDGWKLVLIMRLSPVIPYNLLNIAMATTSMPFWQFSLVSAVGIVFECSIFCYIGSVASSITSIVSGDAKGSVVEWLFLGLSLVMCVLGAIFVSYSIKSAVRRADEHEAASMHGPQSERATLIAAARSASPHEQDDAQDGSFELRPVGASRVASLSEADGALRILVPSLEEAPSDDDDDGHYGHGGGDDQKNGTSASGAETTLKADPIRSNETQTVAPALTPIPAPMLPSTSAASGHFISTAEEPLAERQGSGTAVARWSPQKAVRRQPVTGPLLGKAKRSPLPLLGGGGAGAAAGYVHSSGSDGSGAGSSPRLAEMTAFSSSDVALGATAPKMRRPSAHGTE